MLLSAALSSGGKSGVLPLLNGFKKKQNEKNWHNSTSGRQTIAQRSGAPPHILDTSPTIHSTGGLGLYIWPVHLQHRCPSVDSPCTVPLHPLHCRPDPQHSSLSPAEVFWWLCNHQSTGTLWTGASKTYWLSASSWPGKILYGPAGAEDGGAFIILNMF